MREIENILLNYINEPGIIKIILNYKKDLEKRKRKKKNKNNKKKKRAERKLLRLHLINLKINMRN
jgi:hypothetical protein